jgi:hypothetical protein
MCPASLRRCVEMWDEATTHLIGCLNASSSLEADSGEERRKLLPWLLRREAKSSAQLRGGILGAIRRELELAQESGSGSTELVTNALLFTLAWWTREIRAGDGADDARGCGDGGWRRGAA